MTVLIIIAIVLLGLAFVMDAFGLASDDQGVCGMSLINIFPITFAIVVLAIALGSS